MKQNIEKFDCNKKDRTAYLLSFLSILVDKAGGTLTIEHLSDYAGRTMRLGMSLDTKCDKVTLTTDALSDARKAGIIT